MIRTEKRLRLCWTLLILNLCFIWGNSLLSGSVSGSFSDWVKLLLQSVLPGGPEGGIGGGLLRKLAHFTEFACLGAVFSWLFGMLKRNPGWVLACGFGTACVDETIQCFVPDRGPSLRDVGIDTCGCIVGMLILLTGHFISKKIKQHVGGNQV